MEIRIYDNEMTFRGIIENQQSLIWARSYNDVGSFTLTAPVTARNVELLLPGRFVWIRGKVEAGIIESVHLDQDHTRHIIEVKGRFLESLMYWRLIRPATVTTTNHAVTFEGTVEDAMRSFFTGANDIDNIVLGERHGYEETIDIQVIYGNLLEYESNLAKSAGYGFRFVPNFVDKTITFDIYKGLDHSAGQSDRPRVVFSPSYQNLITADYQYNDQLHYNVCYVGGEGEEDGDPQKIYVIAGDDSVKGILRRELYIKGTTQSNGLSILQYRAKLQEEGNLALAESKEARSFTFQIDPNGNFKYGKNFDLGDIVTIIKDDWNLNEDLRITAISEVYETIIPKLEITLGSTLPEKITWKNNG